MGRGSAVSAYARQEELLRAFGVGFKDLRTIQAGRLVARQVKRMWRLVAGWVVAVIVVDGALVGGYLAAAVRPLTVARTAGVSATAAVVMALGFLGARASLRAARAGIVSRVVGEVTITGRGKAAGLAVGGRRYRLPAVACSQVVDGGRYRVYVAGRDVVAMEPEEALRYVNLGERYTIGVDDKSGRCYVAIPVANRMVDYEEFYAIDRPTYERFRTDPIAAGEFVDRCRQRQLDHLLFLQPGTDRGSPS